MSCPGRALLNFASLKRTIMASKPSKPKISEVHAFLRKHNGLIVHFSGAPKGAGKERGSAHLFPADLRHVINGCAMGGLSCSVVRPGDIFHGFKRNATGCIGVVLDLKADASLVAADPQDCGSSEDEHGNRRVDNERDISFEDLERTFRDRLVDGYNEWVVRDYVVRGIFAMKPFDVSILKIPEYPDDMPDYLRSSKISTRFSGCRTGGASQYIPGFDNIYVQMRTYFLLQNTR